ncbi:MAG: NAD(P)H-hydrate epimerase, partial [Nitrososphaerales archaeon]
MKVCRNSEIRELDKRAMEEYGISEEILMENAGESAYFVILKEFGVRGKRFAIFCGPGNNGGDGFVVARKLHSNGAYVKIFLLAEKEKYKGSAKKNFEIISKFPIEIEKANIDLIKNSLDKIDAIVDAIFGTGLERNIEGTYRDVIDLINKSKKPIFSIDIPSGINGDTGQEMGISIKADYTIAYGLPKIGNLIYPGYGKCGKLYVSHISYPIPLQNSESIKVEVSIPIPIPERDPNATKFSYGPILTIAGSRNYFWAPIASAYSFLKAGGGYSYLACPASIMPFLAERGREVVFLPQIEETSEGSLSLKAKESILRAYKERRPKMVLIGPGLSTNEETQELIRELVKIIDTPILIDGDGITAISKDVSIIKQRNTVTILTPHVGEMSRLTRIERERIEKNRVDILQEYSKDLKAIIVLKGPHTL